MNYLALSSHEGCHGLKKGQDYYGQKSEDFVSHAGSHGLKKGQDYRQESDDYLMLEDWYSLTSRLIRK